MNITYERAAAVITALLSFQFTTGLRQWLRATTVIKAKIPYDSIPPILHKNQKKSANKN